MLNAFIGNFIYYFLDFISISTYPCLYRLNLPWADLLEIQREGLNRAFSSKKEHILCFKGKEFNVLRESKGDDVCNTNCVNTAFHFHLLK